MLMNLCSPILLHIHVANLRFHLSWDDSGQWERSSGVAQPIAMKLGHFRPMACGRREMWPMVDGQELGCHVRGAVIGFHLKPRFWLVESEMCWPWLAEDEEDALGQYGGWARVTISEKNFQIKWLLIKCWFHIKKPHQNLTSWRISRQFHLFF